MSPRLFALRATLAQFERSHSASPAHQGLRTAEAHFNGADIVVHSVNRANPERQVSTIAATSSARDAFPTTARRRHPHLNNLLGLGAASRLMSA